MGIGSRRSAVALGVLLVALVGVSAVLLLRPLLTATALQRAVGGLPESVLRVSFTDWAAVAADEAADGIDADSSAEELEAFLDAAFEKDLTVSSSLSSSIAGMAAGYGITPLQAEWEVYGQGRAGSVAILRLGDDVDLDALEDSFETMGYQAPADGAGSGGVWTGTPELVVGLDEPLMILQENVAVLPDERLFLMSDDPAFLETSMGAVRGDKPTLQEEDGLTNLIASLDEPTTATVWVGDFVCEDLAMSQADPTDAETGRDLVESAGGVHPLTGMVFAQDADRGLHVVLAYADADQASEDLQARADLAVGPAPGQGGTFADRFEVTSAVADGPLVTLEADPLVPRVLSDLGQGPVLFATC